MRVFSEMDLSAEAEREALLAARTYVLPFGRQSWRGHQGSSQGQGVGNSIDFHDHRAYQFGDDPRYIHWAAYARTGQYVMKLFRAEQSPLVEICVDVTESMELTPEKALVTEALLKFCLANADRVGAPVRVYAVGGVSCAPVAVEEIRAGGWRSRLGSGDRQEGRPICIQWRPQSMRIFISDLLYPGDPLSLLGGMSSGAGLSMIFAPWDVQETDWGVQGNVELEDCETHVVAHRRVTAEWAKRYVQAYKRHFFLWNEACVRYNVGLARVAGGKDFKTALAEEALRAGLVEPA